MANRADSQIADPTRHWLGSSIPKRVPRRRCALRFFAKNFLFGGLLINPGRLNRLGLAGSICLLVASIGCAKLPKNDLSDTLLPSNFRDWSPEFAVLPTAKFNGDLVTVEHVRNCSYVTEKDYVLEYETREYDLNELQTVDFFVVPFQGAEFIAHTMLSFGFTDGRYLAVSAEVRTEKGESYSAVGGFTRQLELTYVVADERDLVLLRTHHRDAEVYLYRTTTPPDKARELFVDVMRRVNQLAEKPEFYDTIANNCTTNIVDHVNRIAPRRVPFSVGVLLPGYSDRDAYELGLLDQSLPFAQLKARSKINDLAGAYQDAPDFSTKIRRRMLESPGSLLLRRELEDLPSDGEVSEPVAQGRRDGSVRPASFEMPDSREMPESREMPVSRMSRSLVPEVRSGSWIISERRNSSR